MTRDAALYAVFSARTLVRGWTRNLSSWAANELESAMKRLEAIETLFPELQAEIELIRAAYDQLDK